MRWADRTFPSNPESVRRARQFARDTAEDWNLRAEDLPLVVSELVTNAVVHTQAEYSVRLSEEQQDLIVRVEDRGSAVPEASRASLDAPGGRGLPMVQSLARQWGICALPHGKIVWALLDTENGPTRGGHDE